MTGKVEKVDISRLYVGDQEHRMEIDIENLAESILKTGQINPITVKKDGARYRVIAGRRRTAALKLLEEQYPEKKIKALIYVTDLSDLENELIKIDENIMRQQLKGAELDEAIYRRKQIYEELHPETKQHLSGAHARHAKATGKKTAKGFTVDAARKLGTSRRTIEKAVARAAKASSEVKKARAKGQLSPSKVDLLVTLPEDDQDLLLRVIRNKEVAEVKSLVALAKKRGAKAVVLDLEEVREEDPRMKPIIKAAKHLKELIQESLEERLTFEGDSKHDSLRAMDELAKRIEKFTDFQRASLGYVRAINRKGDERKIIRRNV